METFDLQPPQPPILYGPFGSWTLCPLSLSLGSVPSRLISDGQALPVITFLLNSPNSDLITHLHSFVLLFSHLWNQLLQSVQSHSSLQGFKTIPGWMTGDRLVRDMVDAGLMLVASLVRDVAMPLKQCPYYQYAGAHFTDLGRMTGCQPHLVSIQRPTGLKLRTRGSQASHSNH